MHNVSDPAHSVKPINAHALITALGADAARTLAKAILSQTAEPAVTVDRSHIDPAAIDADIMPFEEWIDLYRAEVSS